MSARMALGTAQLGSAYGINNQVGDLSEAQAFEVLDVAHENGVDLLDTAEGYGRSEELIGEYLGTHSGVSFDISTKLTGALEVEGASVEDAIAERLRGSLDRLECDRLLIYYLHSFEMCNDGLLMAALREMRKKGYVERLGVSVYEPAELEFILDNPDLGVTAVQIPFNILNASSWLERGLLDRAQTTGVMLLARSVYVQGLIFKDLDDGFVRKLGLESAIRRVADLSEALKVTKAQLACDFVRSFDAVSYIIVGCETPMQVEDNALMFERENCWDDSDLAEQISFTSSIDPSLVDPRTWH